jgi:hypothetical protein
MASEAEIASLRRAAGLDEDDLVYTDELLGGLFDDLGLPTASATIWREKAAAAAGLVDTTESGSTRRLSQLYDQSLKMAGAWTPPDEVTEPGASSFTVEIERV